MFHRHSRRRRCRQDAERVKRKGRQIDEHCLTGRWLTGKGQRTGGCGQVFRFFFFFSVLCASNFSTGLASFLTSCRPNKTARQRDETRLIASSLEQILVAEHKSLLRRNAEERLRSIRTEKKLHTKKGTQNTTTG